jgi:hypothetical protein
MNLQNTLIAGYLSRLDRLDNNLKDFVDEAFTDDGFVLMSFDVDRGLTAASATAHGEKVDLWVDDLIEAEALALGETLTDSFNKFDAELKDKLASLLEAGARPIVSMTIRSDKAAIKLHMADGDELYPLAVFENVTTLH